jgi:hypothetical protein
MELIVNKLIDFERTSSMLDMDITQSEKENPNNI